MGPNRYYHHCNWEWEGGLLIFNLAQLLVCRITYYELIVILSLKHPFFELKVRFKPYIYAASSIA